MTAFTLSGLPLFDGKNPLGISFQMSGGFVLATKVVGTVVGTSTLTGGPRLTLGKSNPPGGTEHLLIATPAFLGTIKASVAAFQATVAATEKRIGAKADFGGNLDAVKAAAADTWDFRPLPIAARAQFAGSLIASAVVGGSASVGRRVVGTAGFAGAVKYDWGALTPVNGTNNVVASAATLLPATNGANVIGVLRSPPYAYFDGAATFLYYSDQTDTFLNGSSAFSCALIITPEIVNVSQSGTLLGKHDPSGTQNGWEVTWDKTTGLITVLVSSNTAGTNKVSRVNTVAIRTRSIVSFTYDGTDIQIHVNGALDNGTQTTTGTPGAMSTTTAKFAMGARVNASLTPTNFHKGAVHGVWIWNVVLTNGECNALTAQGVIPSPPQAANLKVAWHPYALQANATDVFFNGWVDSILGRLLSSIATPKPPVFHVRSANRVNRLFSDAWDKDFINNANIYGADSNLTSNFPINSSATDLSQNNTMRIFTPPTFQTNPNISTGYRDFRTDFTLFLRARKGSTSSVDVTFFDVKGVGLRLFYDNTTRDLFLFIGVTGTTTRYDYGRNYPLSGGNQAILVVRWNSVDQTVSLFIGNQKVVPNAITTTGTPTGGTGLEVSKNCDYRDARVVAACVTDGFITNVLNDLASVDADSFTLISPSWQLALQYDPVPSLPFGLTPVIYRPNDVDETPAPLFIAQGAHGTLELAGQPNDGDTFNVSDGSSARSFEFNNSGGVAGANIAVTIAGTIAGTLDNLIAAINMSPLNITASARVNFDATGDGIFEGGYTRLTHDQVPMSPFSDTQNVAILIPNNTSGKLFATGMHRAFLFDEELPDTASSTDQALFTFGTYFRYTDEPYPVQEPEDLLEGGASAPTFQNPLPTIVSVTADIAHNVVAIGNAGPTDAGSVRSWWEVEIESGNTETLIRIDEQDNNFSLNHDHIDTFTIPDGLNFDGKRIRFVIQSQIDTDQIWYSLFVRMDGDGFDNGSVEVIILPGAGAPETPVEVELTLAVTSQAFALESTRQAQLGQLSVSERSRYKLTRVFFNDERDPRLPSRNPDGLEFGLMSVLTDFEDLGSDFQIHRVRTSEIGFLDQIAYRYYGAGFEDMWWVIAYTNRIIDPEADMYDGQELVIPGRTVLTSFLTRKPEAVGS